MYKKFHILLAISLVVANALIMGYSILLIH